MLRRLRLAVVLLLLISSPAQAVRSTDWSVAMVESTMARYTPSTLGGWSYTNGLYLYGQYLVYQRTRDPKYLAYLKVWVDRFVDSSGNISNSFNNLDSMLSGRTKCGPTGSSW